MVEGMILNQAKAFETSAISFPGLGISEFKLSSVAFTIFGHDIMWYGVIMAIAVVVCFYIFATRAKREGIKIDNCVDITLVAIPCAIVGGRLYFVIFYGGYTTFKDIIAVWDGGIAFYGVFIGGLIGVLITLIIKKLNIFTMLDLIFSSLIIGQSIGRWGNFTNGECYGGLVSDKFLFAMGLNNTSTISTFGTLDTVYVHPYFLYESAWTLLGFILISAFYKKKAYHGEVALWYLAWYGLGRGILENLRMDSLYIGDTGIRVSSMLGLIGAGICIPLIIIFRIMYYKKRNANMFERSMTPDLAMVLGFRKKIDDSYLINKNNSTNDESNDATENGETENLDLEENSEIENNDVSENSETENQEENNEVDLNDTIDAGGENNGDNN